MNNTRETRRPAAPGATTKPGDCRYCGEPTGSRARAHPECRDKFRKTNVPAAIREYVLDRDDYTCIDCRTRFPASMLEVDHDHELADGGRNDPNNYIVRCLDDHDAKTQESLMARTATTKKSSNSRGSRAAATAQVPEKPSPAGPARTTASFACLTGGGYLAASPWIGDTYLAPTVGAIVGTGLAAAALHGARYVHWRRVCEAQRVYERLAKITGDPYAGRKSRFKVNTWGGLEPHSVTLRYGPQFPDTDPAAWEKLAAAFAATLRVPHARIGHEQLRGGRARLYLRHDTDQARALPMEVLDAPAHEDARARTQDEVIARVRDALSAVLGDDCTVEIESWWPDGTPRTGTITYPPRATKVARESRADLPTVMGDAYEPRSEHGLWQFTWQPSHDRFRFADVPDALAPVVPLAPVDPDVDLRRGVVLGITEDGRPWRQPILEDHILVAGTTGSGKGSVLWGIIRALEPLITDGRCLLYVSDPKGGMEFGAIETLAHRFVLRDGTARMLEEAVQDMTAQQRRLSAVGARKLEQPTRENPLRVIVVDELANFAGDKEVAALMATLLQQGRAVGVVVIGALQDARVKAIDNRDLFKSAIALRLRARSQVDMVLGAGMRTAGAVCDRIPKNLPGIGYVVTEDQPDPVRVRAAEVPDSEIARMTGAQPEPAPAHGALAHVGEQLALPAADPAPKIQVAPAVASAPSAPIKVKDLAPDLRVVLPEDEDPVTIISAEPDPDDPEDRIEVTYQYLGETSERVCSFERMDEAIRV